MKTLLHICCGPCSTATIEHWRSRGQDVVGFFFNPNIHPLLEFRRRLTGARDLAGATKLTLQEDLEYDPGAWFSRVGTKDRDRCVACIGWRLERSADEALSLGCDAFTTSLAISPWQNHDAIKRTGEEAASQRGLVFLYEDLRPLYGQSRRLAREAGLYRQSYCGCVLSEWERYCES